MRLRSTLVFVAIVASAGVASAGQPGRSNWRGEDKIVTIARADPRLAAARARAAATLDDFLAVALSHRSGTSAHAVKIAIADGDETEVFWLNELRREANGRFSARINNTPEVVRTVAFGQRLEFGRGDIVDWAYTRNGRIIGNHTICVLLDETTQPKLSEFVARYGVDCSWNK
jgi:uncharacterized protein YegJ (DUF2314 family)